MSSITADPDNSSIIASLSALSVSSSASVSSSVPFDVASHLSSLPSASDIFATAAPQQCSSSQDSVSVLLLCRDVPSASAPAAVPASPAQLFFSFFTLVHRRSASIGSFARHLGCPGGSVEAHETFGAALIRETLEESGIDITPYKDNLFLIEDRVNKFKRRHITFGLIVPHSVQFNAIRPTTLAELDRTFGSEPNYHRWISLSQMHNQGALKSFEDIPLHPAYRQSIITLRKFFRNPKQEQTDKEVESKAELKESKENIVSNATKLGAASSTNGNQVSFGSPRGGRGRGAGSVTGARGRGRGRG